MKTLSALAIAMCCAIVAQGQAKEPIFEVVNQNGIDENRYEGIEKNPYLFKEFASAEAHNKAKDEIEAYTLNFNGYTGEFEFIYQDKTIELDQNYYDEIVVTSCVRGEDVPEKYNFESARFVKGLNPEAPGKFQMEVFSNKEIQVFKTFEARLSSREITDPARGVVKMETFSPGMDYFMVKDGKVHNIGLNKKKLIAVLNAPAVESFMKKNKIKVKTEQELTRVLDFYHNLTVPETPDSEVVAASGS